MPLPRRLDRRRGQGESSRAGDLADFLRQETTGGRLLLLATALALVWANVDGDGYRSFWATDLTVGPAWLRLDLGLGDWVADGLLAIFFFVAGVEVKRELAVGELADRRAAALPVCAAAGGIVVPAAVALAVSGGAAADGGAWAIPVATDIAFALGVLAIVGATLPAGVRVLLLSMAVIDDLAAIALVAVLFTHGLAPAWLAGAVALATLYWALARSRRAPGRVLFAVAIAVWICVHGSGVHATVAGILLGLLTPVRPAAGEAAAPGPRFEHALHPISAGVIVPLFALAAAGIPLAALADVGSDRVALGVLAGLLVGKVVGILAGARLAVRLRVAALPTQVAWADVVPIAVLGAIGYTVSLLLARLSLADAAAQQRAAGAVLLAAVVAATVAALLLRRRSRA